MNKKKRISLTGIAVTTVLVLFSAVACGPDPRDVAAVKLDQTKLMLTAEETAVLKATVEPANATVQTVTWSVKPEDVVTLKADGNSCTVTPVKNGTATVTATVGAVKAVCTVTSGISIDDLNFIELVENGETGDLESSGEPVSIGWEKNGDGTVPLTAANLEKIEALTSLALPTELYPQADSLDGLKWFTGLEQLALGFKSASDVLSPVKEADLSSLTRLNFLSVSGLSLTDLDLSANALLKTVIVAANPSLTALVLPESTTLSTVSCTMCPLTLLTVPQVPNLMALVMMNTRLSELDITGCPNLTMLMCGNQTSDGTTPQMLTLTLTAAQKTKWDSEWSKDNQNVDVKVK